MVEYEYQHSTDDVHRMVLVVLQYFYCLERKTIIYHGIERILVFLAKISFRKINDANIFVDEKTETKFNVFLYQNKPFFLI